ncbi:MAG: hypothetical protein K8I04_07490 [Gammaproteobacteria bacterium]|nr:hypothetical protein [Gammaproteobacteria bacterium]
MTRYCGEVKEVMGAYTTVTLTLGDIVMKKFRLCMSEVADYIRPGDRVCLYAFGHLLKTKIIIGVKSETGSSWTMSFGRFLITFILYLTLWPVLVSLGAIAVFALPPMIFGWDTLSNLGFLLGIIYGVVISLISGIRLLKTYWEMQADCG